MLCDRDKDLGTRMFGDPFLEYRAKIGLRIEAKIAICRLPCILADR